MPSSRRTLVLKKPITPAAGVRPDLTTTCCIAYCALATGELPSDGEVRRASLKIGKAWLGGQRRLPWETVSEHIEGIKPLREALRLVDLVDAVGTVPEPARDSEGRSLHSFRDLATLVSTLFKSSDRLALVWECKPCALMMRLEDGVWAAKPKPNDRTVTMTFVKITSISKAVHFIGSPPTSASYPCNIIELRSR